MSLKWIPFTLNGQVQKILVNPKRTLLDVVRNDFGLVGTKEGCTEGICGLCTMLIDGKPINTCVYPVEKAAGKQILTIEGIGRPDKLHPIQEAFKQAGAAQCGYCTPGMVLLAKAILDHNPHPARDEVRKRISRNLCRCTGYEKIIDGVMLAAKFLQDPVALDQAKKERLDLGGRVPQLNSPEKVTGQMRYTADIRINGICHAKVLRSSYAHAKILSLDTRDAEKMSGVVTVCTAKDIKGVNKIEDDLRVLADHVVRYPGEPVAIVVAYTEEIAASALNKIKVAYEELPSLTNPLDAIKPGAIEILPDEFPGNIVYTQDLIKGNVEEGFQQADLIVESDYYTPSNAHAYLEPDVAVGYFDEEGRLTIYAPGQGPHSHRDIIAAMLDVKQDRVRVIEDSTGGGFGGRIDPFLHVLIGLATYKARCPVRLRFFLEDTFIGTGKRHPFYIKMKTGATKDGKLVAHEAKIIGDAGGSSILSTGILMRSVVHSYGPYELPNVKVKGMAVLTNNTPSVAMRGFGVTQMTFAVQMQMNKLADQLKMNVLELEKINGFKQGSVTATGQKIEEPNGYIEVLEAIQNHWRNCDKYVDPEKIKNLPPHIKRGVGFASHLYGVGMTGWSNRSVSIVEVMPNGKILIRIGAADLGQGSNTVMALIAADEMKVPLEMIEFITSDSLETPDCYITSASRQTFYTGNATLGAVKKLKLLAFKAASKELGVPEDDFACQEGWISSRSEADKKISLKALVEKGYMLRAEDEFDVAVERLDPLTGQGAVYAVYTYGAAAVEVEVNAETGEVKVLSAAVSDQCGKAINILGIEGQIEGGVAMGIGFALKEEYITGKTKGFKQYHLTRAREVPEISKYLVEVPQRLGPRGAIGMGESPQFPIAPAIISAIHDACGIWINELPAHPERVLKYLNADSNKRTCT